MAKVSGKVCKTITRGIVICFKTIKIKGGGGNDLLDPIALYTSEVPVEFVPVRMR